ncbi:MAG: hypothetical protein ACYTER_03320 [Planctomycetota bacterium]
MLLTKTGDYQITIINQASNDTAAYGLAFELLEPIPGDIVVDYIVDIVDLTAVTEEWITAANLDDFAVLAANWLRTDGRYVSN